MPALPYTRLQVPIEGLDMHCHRIANAMLAGLLGLAASAQALAAAPPDKVMQLIAGGTVEVAPDGSVAKVQVEDGIESKLAGALANSLGKLHFAPVKVQGQPVSAVTGFEVVLLGRQEGKGFSVCIDSIDFRAPKGMPAVTTDGEHDGITGKQLAPPGYPREQQRAGRMGEVKLAIRVSADGRAAEVAAVDSFLFDQNVPPGQGGHALAQFEKSAMDAAKHWTFNVPSDFATHAGRDFTVGTSVLFTMIDGAELRKHGQWLVVYKGPKREVTWLPPEQSKALADTALAEGSLGGSNGAFRLDRPIGGTPVF
jgi:hypothetical protein